MIFNELTESGQRLRGAVENQELFAMVARTPGFGFVKHLIIYVAERFHEVTDAVGCVLARVCDCLIARMVACVLGCLLDSLVG